MTQRNKPSALNCIEVKGARVYNLKNINVNIPRDKFIVITGVSGSGKSTLAFDTLYAEGQRRYVESLSSYARQFLGRMNKPEVDYVKGIPPAIAIEQKVNTRNVRSTVGTSTEVYDYLKLLYARVGKTYSPKTGNIVTKDSVADVVKYISTLSESSKVLILSPVTLHAGRSMLEEVQVLGQQGFSRVISGGEVLKISDLDGKELLADTYLLVDRISGGSEENILMRVADSVQTAFYEGGGHCVLQITNEVGIRKRSFSNSFEEDGVFFEEPTENMFAFNSPLGACARCDGYGKVIGIDEDLVIPDKTKTLYEGAVVCWSGDKMKSFLQKMSINATKVDLPIHVPYNKLTSEQKAKVWGGTKYFAGIYEFFDALEKKMYKIQNRVMLARYRGKTTCPDCNGTRLKKDATYVKVGGKSIQELVLLPISELCIFFHGLELSEHDSKIAKRLLIEINTRIDYLCDVGLSYLTLNRLSNTLSGGESQRINLAKSLGSSLVGSMYILDEPSIGLHSRDTDRLVAILRKLQSIGNTVMVVEHDEELIRSADYIIDIGPLAGSKGGEIVYQGDMKGLRKAKNSLTAKYLLGKEQIELPMSRRKMKNKISLKGACENNLKNVDVDFPLNSLTVVTGVSGSGKSTLVSRTFYPALARLFGIYEEKTGQHVSLEGDIDLISGVEFVDQNPIGRSSRSNPVTYLKAYDEIRKLYSNQKISKQYGFTPGTFSFNTEGGRCEECQGDGTITIGMQFMADVKLECESCKGQRFKDDVLEVKYKGANISDLLGMTIDEALAFFDGDENRIAKRIVKKLRPLKDVGLGYIKMGQASSTLSGGESQRVKLAFFLSNERHSPTMYIFDEPTTGLHFHDIKQLLWSFNALIERGHTVLVIEHNLDVVKLADWVIDIGPEGGERGGELVFAGTPEDMIKCEKSYTAQYLKEKLRQ
ncbi:MAG: excinuclease ABC subunit UvrA [Bacteroidales bacterium]